jgi:hypothetical protein
MQGTAGIGPSPGLSMNKARVVLVLVVIGASHKPFLESYLSRMMDIELVQLATFVENAD